ncbi:MAG: GspE/PulE family protein [bacterium]|nr:GspE/PulE family protein [bacterium]
MNCAPARLEDVLVSRGLLTPEVLQQLRLESASSGKSIENLLLERKLIPEQELVQLRASALGIPSVVLEEKGVPADVLGLVPEQIATRYKLFPFDLKDNVLHVAMVDPLDVQVIEFLERKSGHDVRPYLASTSDIERAIMHHYSQSLSTEVSAVLKETGDVKEVPEEAVRAGEVIREAPVSKIVTTLLDYAIKVRASDIHIEPHEDRTRVRFRVDGILQEKLVLPKSVHDSVVSRIKILSGLKIDEKRVPQDGRFNVKIAAEDIDLRISTLPTVFGEKVAIRLLKKTGGIPSLGELGLRGPALKNLEANILRPHGIILITGPTGSGKTTTLYSILSKINTPRVNILTLEDPVEYQISGVNQVQVNPAAGLTFASGLRAFLRQDPNVIMVGEVRDKETTELAVQASLTGHLVLSTLHTNDAAGSLPRLLDMGAEPFLLASTMNAVAGQRVVRKICEACKQALDAPPQVLTDIKQTLGKLFPTNGESKVYKGRGCPKCGNSGYLGRIGIFEVMPISSGIGKLILERSPSTQVSEVAVAEGMITMKQDGYLKVLEGITTIEEILRVAES